MDELKAKLVEASRGMSTQEIADVLAASKHAVVEPQILAAYLKYLGAA